MKKLMSTILILLMCATVLIGCGKTDPVKEDLLNYINKQLPTLVELESKVITEFAANTGINAPDDATLAAKLKDVIIPGADELLSKVKAIVPATEELRKVHNKYIVIVTEQREAFNLLLQAAQKNDLTLVNTINEKLVNADKLVKEYLADLNALKNAHGVVSEKNDLNK
jgi:hypothetical protein